MASAFFKTPAASARKQDAPSGTVDGRAAETTPWRPTDDYALSASVAGLLGGPGLQPSIANNSITASQQLLYKLNLNSTPAAGQQRAWRFPSSRKFLWDRSKSGPVENIQPKDLLPSVEVSAAVLHAASSLHYQSQQNGMHVHAPALVGRIGTAAGSSALQLAIEPKAPGTNRIPDLVDQVHVPCSWDERSSSASTPPASSPMGAASPRPVDGPSLRAALSSLLEQRGPAHLGQLLATACQLSMRPDGTAGLQGRLLLPGSPLALSPLFSKRVCEASPLAQQLSAPQQPGSAPTNGLLSMDQARSLLPLAADDPNVYSMPLVGVWVRGVRSVSHPVVLAACLRFAYASTLPDKALQPDSSFLLAVFLPEGSPLPQCYEARFHDEGGCLSLLQYTYRGELLQQAGSGPGYSQPGASAKAVAGAPLVLRPELESSAPLLLLNPGAASGAAGLLGTGAGPGLSPKKAAAMAGSAAGVAPGWLGSTAGSKYGQPAAGPNRSAGGAGDVEPVRDTGAAASATPWHSQQQIHMRQHSWDPQAGADANAQAGEPTFGRQYSAPSMAGAAGSYGAGGSAAEASSPPPAPRSNAVPTPFRGTSAGGTSGASAGATGLPATAAAGAEGAGVAGTLSQYPGAAVQRPARCSDGAAGLPSEPSHASMGRAHSYGPGGMAHLMQTPAATLPAPADPDPGPYVEPPSALPGYGLGAGFAGRGVAAAGAVTAPEGASSVRQSLDTWLHRWAAAEHAPAHGAGGGVPRAGASAAAAAEAAPYGGAYVGMLQRQSLVGGAAGGAGLVRPLYNPLRSSVTSLGGVAALSQASATSAAPVAGLPPAAGAAAALPPGMRSMRASFDGPLGLPAAGAPMPQATFGAASILGAPHLAGVGPAPGPGTQPPQQQGSQGPGAAGYVPAAFSGASALRTSWTGGELQASQALSADAQAPQAPGPGVPGTDAGQQPHRAYPHMRATGSWGSGGGDAGSHGAEARARPAPGAMVAPHEEQGPGVALAYGNSASALASQQQWSSYGGAGAAGMHASAGAAPAAAAQPPVDVAALLQEMQALRQQVSDLQSQLSAAHARVAQLEQQQRQQEAHHQQELQKQQKQWGSHVPAQPHMQVPPVRTGSEAAFTAAAASMAQPASAAADALAASRRYSGSGGGSGPSSATAAVDPQRPPASSYTAAASYASAAAHQQQGTTSYPRPSLDLSPAASQASRSYASMVSTQVEAVAGAGSRESVPLHSSLHSQEQGTGIQVHCPSSNEGSHAASPRMEGAAAREGHAAGSHQDTMHDLFGTPSDDGRAGSSRGGDSSREVTPRAPVSQRLSTGSGLHASRGVDEAGPGGGSPSSDDSDMPPRYALSAQRGASRIASTPGGIGMGHAHGAGGAGQGLGARAHASEPGLSPTNLAARSYAGLSGPGAHSLGTRRPADSSRSSDSGSMGQEGHASPGASSASSVSMGAAGQEVGRTSAGVGASAVKTKLLAAASTASYPSTAGAGSGLAAASGYGDISHARGHPQTSGPAGGALGGGFNSHGSIGGASAAAGSGAAALLRSSLGGAGLNDLVRTQYVPLEDDSASDDDDMDVQLMRKYGLH